MKQDLEKYYKGWRKALFLYAIVLWIGCYFLFQLIKGAISIPATVPNNDLLNVFISSLLDIIAPNAIILWLYFKVLNYIDKDGWKKKFPQYDVSGIWIDNTTYQYYYDEGGYHINAAQEKMIPATAVITQTCRNVKIEFSSGNDFNWISITADWDDEAYLNILYRVEYRELIQHSMNYPARRYGYEKVHIINDTNSNEKKPKKMSGNYYHCVSDDRKPMFYGEVEYLRQ